MEITIKHALTLILIFLATFTAHAAAESDRPNVVLVMADDQGWGDTGYNWHPELKTPNLGKLAAAGVTPQKQIQPLDGVNLLPLFDRKTDVRERAIPFVANIRFSNSHAALLDWPQKLHTNPVEGRKGGGNESAESTLLYDVSKDPQETTDLAAQQPERATKMKAALDEWKQSAARSLSGADYDGPKSEPALEKLKRKDKKKKAQKGTEAAK